MIPRPEGRGARLLPGRYDTSTVRVSRILALCWLAVAAELPVRATTILMLYLPGRVYIATDSKVASLDGKMAGTTCKIHVSENYVWASAGLLFETNNSFNIEQFVPTGMGDGSDFAADVARLEAHLKLVFPHLMDDVRATGASIDTANIGIALADKRDVGKVSEIFISGKEVQHRDCPGQSCGQMGVFSFGEHRAIDEVLSANRKIWKNMGIITALNYLIGRQAQLTPQYVESPIAIIEITPLGVQWDQKGKCTQ